MHKKQRGKNEESNTNIKTTIKTIIKTFPYQNQNFISISRKIIVPLCSFSEKIKCGCKIWAGKSYYI